jgi:hypothetical protein
MEQFPHLKFEQKIEGVPRFHGGGQPNPQTVENKANRRGHIEKLQRWITENKTNWDESFSRREQDNLAPINPDIKPVFLQINPDLISTEFNLEDFGIEIISEEENGFIIGASIDNFRTLEEKINGFLTSTRGTGKIADFWQISNGNREVWKPLHILSEELYSKWSTIQDDELYPLEVSIAFDKPISKAPDPSKRGFAAKSAKYIQDCIDRDTLLMERQQHFENFINHYGELTSSIIELEDSFGAEVIISGKGLKDLVVNYPFVFEVVEVESIGGGDSANEDFENIEVELLSPTSDSIEVGVIDSGIMEGNRYLNLAINPANSKSYLDGDTSTADYVQRGGHGTKVAGAILYPKGVSSITQPYQLPCFIRNLRVLNRDNQLLHKNPAELVKNIVNDNDECKIFNLSINSYTPYRKKHMSMWASMIDSLINEKNVLFIISAGNIRFDTIQQYISNGNIYPGYLNETVCRVLNPASSSFGITVGSINHNSFEDGDWKTLGELNEVSGYSRTGPGIWGHIKPDVVEYGGGVVFSKNGAITVKEHGETATELIRSTLNGGNAYGKDSVGTSFAAPKVAHIAAKLSQLYPEESVNLTRAFIAQGARLPGGHFQNPVATSIQHFGYGVPSIDRVTKNSDHRITFYSTGNIKSEEGHLYSLAIPSELRNPADEYDILIEVTLAYTAKIRRTRQKTKSYLSTWLDWSTSKIAESFESFKDFALSEIEQRRTNYNPDDRNSLPGFPWKISNRSDNGVNNFNRNNSTLQKDWTIIKSYELHDQISFAVKAHKGWDKNKSPVNYALTVSLEILGANIPIYESIRIENEVEIPV